MPTKTLIAALCSEEGDEADGERGLGVLLLGVLIAAFLDVFCFTQYNEINYSMR
jgi:hypothetical protein